MSIRALGPLLCGGFLLLATTAHAVSGDPLPGIDVSMEQNPGGIIIAQGTTNGSGEFNFASVPPGTYRIVLRKVEPPPAGASRATNNYNTAKSNSAGLAVNMVVGGRAQATTHALAKVKNGMIIGTITLTAVSSVSGTIKDGPEETKAVSPSTKPSAR